MMLAQRLYEGVELGEEGCVGLITYMRTDSTRVSDDAMTEVREYDRRAVRAELSSGSAQHLQRRRKTRRTRTKRSVRLRRCAMPDQVEQYLAEDEFKVYKLIWKRFVASQMMPAVFDQTTDRCRCQERQRGVLFRATGSVQKFDGFLKVYEEAKEGKDEEDEELKHKLPALEAGQTLTLRELKPEQHFTEPPPRYNEATLVKELEERRHRTTFDVRVHSFHHSGARVRAERSAASSFPPSSAWS